MYILFLLAMPLINQVAFFMIHVFLSTDPTLTMSNFGFLPVNLFNLIGIDIYSVHPGATFSSI